MRIRINRAFLALLLALVGQLTCAAPPSDRIQEGDYVVVLHGFLRASDQMQQLGNFLADQGYSVVYFNYPSREKNIPDIADQHLLPFIQHCCPDRSRKINFVAYSAGGIVARYFLLKNRPGNVGRMVMLAPPNQGTEFVDFVSHSEFIARWLGPVAEQLRAAPDSFVNKIDYPDLEIGVIAGNRSIDPISTAIVPGPDDGRIAIKSTRFPAMKDFLVVNRTHTFIMDGPEVHQAVMRFLQTGSFRE